MSSSGGVPKLERKKRKRRQFVQKDDDDVIMQDNGKAAPADDEGLIEVQLPQAKRAKTPSNANGATKPPERTPSFTILQLMQRAFPCLAAALRQPRVHDTAAYVAEELVRWTSSQEAQALLRDDDARDRQIELEWRFGVLSKRASPTMRVDTGCVNMGVLDTQLNGMISFKPQIPGSLLGDAPTALFRAPVSTVAATSLVRLNQFLAHISRVAGLACQPSSSGCASRAVTERFMDRDVYRLDVGGTQTRVVVESHDDEKKDDRMRMPAPVDMTTTDAAPTVVCQQKNKQTSVSVTCKGCDIYGALDLQLSVSREQDVTKSLSAVHPQSLCFSGKRGMRRYEARFGSWKLVASLVETKVVSANASNVTPLPDTVVQRLQPERKTDDGQTTTSAELFLVECVPEFELDFVGDESRPFGFDARRTVDSWTQELFDALVIAQFISGFFGFTGGACGCDHSSSTSLSSSSSSSSMP